MGIMSKRKVSEEFKKQCVESYRRRGNRSAESVAAELDVGKSTLAKWVNALRMGAVGNGIGFLIPPKSEAPVDSVLMTTPHSITLFLWGVVPFISLISCH